MRGNRIIPTIGNLGMHKLYIADAKSSFGGVRWWLAPSTNPARRPHRGPLSRFPLGDDKTRGCTMKESPLAKSTKLASKRIAELEFARAGSLFAVTHALSEV